MAREASESRRKAGKGKPYNERTDLEKLQSQWNKLSGLHLREEPSAAIVRCSTAAEIAANYAIRHEWARQTEFDASVVDGFLRWANGLKGKVEKLFVPVYFAYPDRSKTGKALISAANEINEVRNRVVHQGAFSTKVEAEAVMAKAKAFIDMIIGLSVDGFDIQDTVKRH